MHLTPTVLIFEANLENCNFVFFTEPLYLCLMYIHGNMYMIFFFALQHRTKLNGFRQCRKISQLGFFSNVPCVLSVKWLEHGDQRQRSQTPSLPSSHSN